MVLLELKLGWYMCTALIPIIVITAKSNNDETAEGLVGLNLTYTALC